MTLHRTTVCTAGQTTSVPRPSRGRALDAGCGAGTFAWTPPAAFGLWFRKG